MRGYTPRKPRSQTLEQPKSRGGGGARLEGAFSQVQRRPPGGGYPRRPIRTGTCPRGVGKRLRPAPRSKWRSRRSGRSLRMAPGTLSRQARRRFQIGRRNLPARDWQHGHARARRRRGGHVPVRPVPDRREHGWALSRRSGGQSGAQRLAGRGYTGRPVWAAAVPARSGGVPHRHPGQARVRAVSFSSLMPLLYSTQAVRKPTDPRAWDSPGRQFRDGYRV